MRAESPPDRRDGWRGMLPEPFWWNLLTLLMLSVLTMVPLFAVCTVFWPSARGAHAALFAVISYLIALPITWRLFGKRKP